MRLDLFAPTKSSSGHCTSLARVRTLAVTRITASPCARVQYKQIEILQRGRLQDWKITNACLHMAAK